MKKKKAISQNNSQKPSSNNKKIKEENKEKKVMIKFLLVAVYLTLSVSGLILYKYGANKSFEISLAGNVFNMKISLISILGLACYLFSFLLYMIILPKFNISYIMPITSGITYIGTFILSYLVLNERLTTNGIIGAVIILFGIIIINIK